MNLCILNEDKTVVSNIQTSEWQAWLVKTGVAATIVEQTTIGDVIVTTRFMGFLEKDGCFETTVGGPTAAESRVKRYFTWADAARGHVWWVAIQWDGIKPEAKKPKPVTKSATKPKTEYEWAQDWGKKMAKPGMGAEEELPEATPFNPDLDNLFSDSDNLFSDSDGVTENQQKMMGYAPFDSMAKESKEALEKIKSLQAQPDLVQQVLTGTAIFPTLGQVPNLVSIKKPKGIGSFLTNYPDANVSTWQALHISLESCTQALVNAKDAFNTALTVFGNDPTEVNAQQCIWNRILDYNQAVSEYNKFAEIVGDPVEVEKHFYDKNFKPKSPEIKEVTWPAKEVTWPAEDWVVKQEWRSKGNNGLMVLEDFCKCGVGHPNKAWLKIQDLATQKLLGNHGCCGCCSGDGPYVNSDPYADQPGTWPDSSKKKADNNYDYPNNDSYKYGSSGWVK